MHIGVGDHVHQRREHLHKGGFALHLVVTVGIAGIDIRRCVSQLVRPHGELLVQVHVSVADDVIAGGVLNKRGVVFLVHLTRSKVHRNKVQCTKDEYV